MGRILEDYLEVVSADSEGDLYFLKPCPICGENGVPRYIRYSTAVGDRWRVVCCNCMLTLDPGWTQSKAAVQAIWNKRAAVQ